MEIDLRIKIEKVIIVTKIKSYKGKVIRIKNKKGWLVPSIKVTKILLNLIKFFFYKKSIDSIFVILN